MMENDVDDLPFKNLPDSPEDEFGRAVQIRDAARRAFIAADTNQRLRRAAAAASRPSRLKFSPGDLVYFHRQVEGWSAAMATVVSQVGVGHYYVDYNGRVLKVAAEQLRNPSERERQARQTVARAEGDATPPAEEDLAEPPTDAPMQEIHGFLTPLFPEF